MRRMLVRLFCLMATIATLANPARYFSAANEAMKEGRLNDALDAYREAAEESPESAEISYNLGIAQYRMGRFEEAAGTFEYAASLAESTTFRSLCWYNMGNSMFQVAQALQEAEPQAAISYCRQAAWLYRIALEDNASFTDAAYNLEIAQRMALSIAADIEKQQQEQQEQNELLKYIREKLQEFIDRQTSLLNTKDTGRAQQQLESETRALAAQMAESGLHEDIPLPDGSNMPGPLLETYRHTVAAAEAMVVPDQSTALGELVAALGATPQDPDNPEGESDEDSESDDEYDMDSEMAEENADMYEEADPFGDFSDYEEIRGMPPPNKTEMDILAEEIKNQERRNTKKSGEYKAVEKDW